MTTTGNTTTTNYAGGYVYQNNALQFVFTPEGYATPNGSGAFDYVYQYKDLPIAIGMGNIRLSYSDANNDGLISATSEIVEENNYYPFGLKHKGYNTGQNGRHHKYMFGGKEFQDDVLGTKSLEMYDFGARNYDAALGRWMNLDPLAEKYMTLSPYVSFGNNPLSFTDPDGKAILFWQMNEKKEWVRVEFSKLNKDVQKALEAFAKTKEGYGFFKDFAQKNDKIGSVEFKDEGKFSNINYSIRQKDRYAERQAENYAKYDSDRVEPYMNINITNRYDFESEGERIAYFANLIGHEAFIHQIFYMYDVLEAFTNGDHEKVNELMNKRNENSKSLGPEHTGYINNDSKFHRMKTYLSQLRQILNPKDVNKIIEEDIQNLKKYGN